MATTAWPTPSASPSRPSGRPVRPPRPRRGRSRPSRPGHGRRSSPEWIALVACEGMEGLLEAPRDGAGIAAADRPTVHPRDGDHLGAGAGEEALLGRVDVEAREPRLARRDARLGGELEQHRARDALEGAVLRCRREDRPAADDVEGVARAL